MEDGLDLSEVKIGESEILKMRQQLLPNQRQVKVGIKKDIINGEITDQIKWMKHPKQIMLNVNKYIAKYNFEIARKLSGEFYSEMKQDSRQELFNKKAIMFTIDGVKIPDLLSIPTACKLVLVSQVITENEKKQEDDNKEIFDLTQENFKGLMGNIYKFQDIKSNKIFEQKRIKRRINQSKDRWFYKNLNTWNQVTPGIQSQHKLEDLNLHFKDDMINEQNQQKNISRGSKLTPMSKNNNQLIVSQGQISEFGQYKLLGLNYGNDINLNLLSNQEFVDQKQYDNINSFMTETQQEQQIRINQVNQDFPRSSLDQIRFQNHQNQQNEQYNKSNVGDFSPQSNIMPIRQRSQGNHKSVNLPNSRLSNQKASVAQRQQTNLSKTKHQSQFKITDNLSSACHNKSAHQLTYKDIEMWASKYDLSWKEIFELDSEFQSLLKIEKETKEVLLKRVQEMRFDPSIDIKLVQKEISQIPQTEQKIGDNEPGMTLSTFKQYSKMLGGKAKEIKKNIIQAFGVDVSNKNSKIEWEQYLLMNCFLKYFTLQKEQLIKIWIKILDPNGLRHIQMKKLIEFLEILARGTTTDEHTLVSKAYARNLIKCFEKEDCLSENGNEVLMEKVEEAFKNGTIEIEILNQTLRVECLYLVKSKHYTSD
eukprot:403343544